MPKGAGGRSYKGGHKGQKRHFTSPEELEALKEKEERERQWRKRQGKSSEEEEEDDEENAEDSGSDSDASNDVANSVKIKKKTAEGEELEIENPNRLVTKAKKVSQLDLNTDVKTELSRKEREEIERQKARANYLKLHAEGKTEEARADLARLAIIRKQREDAARKRDEERKAKDAAKAAKTDNLNKALGKNRKT